MKIAVVLVTFNRIDCLKKALKLYETQTLLPSYIIVVNNCSSDGTKEYLISWKSNENGIKKLVVNLDKNIGGAGGFGTGIDLAKKLNIDWIWISDDDAYPEKNTLEVLKNKFCQYPETGAFFTSVINNEQIDTSHRRRVKKNISGIHFVPVDKREYCDDFSIDQGSYVGMMVKKDIILDVGSTRRDFFIYYDDTEHTTRISKKYSMLCVPCARVHHNVTVSSEFNWKNYYGFRNSLILIREHYGIIYQYIEFFKRYLLFAAPWNSKYSKKIRSMLLCGLHDGLKNRTGIHPIYKPGWK